MDNEVAAQQIIVECLMNGTGHEHLREGWSDVLDGTWTLGRRAVLVFPPPMPGSDYTLTLDISGVAGRAGSAVQRLIVRINGALIGAVVCRGNRREEIFVPVRMLIADQPVKVELELPDACRPADFGHNEDRRLLALRVHKVTFATFRAPNHSDPDQDRETADALKSIHSLGINCEVGFLQRQVGIERLGLFRWTFAPLAKLVPALERGLVGLGAPGTLQAHIDSRSEFIIRDSVYAFQYHSFVHQTEGGTLESVLHNEYNRLRYLSRSLVEDLKEHQHLFSYHDGGFSGLEEIRRLVAAINQFGPNTLLWLTPTPEGAVPGTAHAIEPGLIQGYVSGFQLPVTKVVPTSEYHDSWIDACRAAHRIWRAGIATAMTDPDLSRRMLGL
jgi:hypothetical protein